MSYLQLVSLLLAMFFVMASNADEASQSDLMSMLDQKLASYDKRIRANSGDGPVRVNVTGYIIRSYDFDEVQNSHKVDMYFRQSWSDKRLQFSRVGTIFGGADLQSRIWIPDTFFTSSPNVKMTAVVNPNTFARITNDGSVYISNLITAEVICDQLHAAFPIDTKICRLNIESCKY